MKKILFVLFIAVALSGQNVTPEPKTLDVILSTYWREVALQQAALLRLERSMTLEQKQMEAAADDAAAQIETLHGQLSAACAVQSKGLEGWPEYPQCAAKPSPAKQ